jgi:hypothetical protein
MKYGLVLCQAVNQNQFQPQKITSMNPVELFFVENPDANECFEALGMVTATREEAELLLAGVKGQMVKNHIKEVGVVYDKDSEKVLEAIIDKEAEVNSYEAAFDIEQNNAKKAEAMNAWKKAKEELTGLEAIYQQALKKEAKDAAAKKDEEEVKDITSEGDGEEVKDITSEGTGTE